MFVLTHHLLYPLSHPYPITKVMSSITLVPLRISLGVAYLLSCSFWGSLLYFPPFPIMSSFLLT